MVNLSGGVSCHFSNNSSQVSLSINKVPRIMSKERCMPFSNSVGEASSRKSEFRLFIFLTAILIPGLTIGLVGAYGFAVWIYQALISGPPAS